MTLWSGFFYSNFGWRATAAANILKVDMDSYNIDAAAPVRLVESSGYNWVIFNYTSKELNNPADYYTIICELGTSQYTKKNIEDENIVVYFYNNTLPIISLLDNDSKGQQRAGSWYWTKISGKGKTYTNAAVEKDKDNYFVNGQGTAFDKYLGSGIMNQFTSMSTNGDTPVHKLHGVSGKRLVGGFLRKGILNPGKSGQISKFFIASGVLKNNTTIKIHSEKPVALLKTNDRDSGIALE